MSIRKISFANNEIYHVFNRGIEKRDVFMDHYDVERFFESLKVFNAINPTGGIYENSFSKKQKDEKRLVDVICYCINPNHFHLVLRQVSEAGIQKFMHRLGAGYPRYFNEKYNRSGVLFQGRFKAKHVNTNEYLLHVSAYVNLNNQLHPKFQLRDRVSKLSRSSWDEYVKGVEGLCKKEIILGQFKNVQEYERFALSSLDEIVKRKEREKGEQDPFFDYLEARLPS